MLIFRKFLAILCKFLRIVGITLLIILLITAIPVTLGLLSCNAPTEASDTPSNHFQAIPLSIQKIENEMQAYHRNMASSYLVFPEWYIVYSSQEYADFLKNHPPSQFPYFSEIEQYWCSYKSVYRLSKKYPSSGGDHLMLMVIGTSFSVEYTIKGIYENTIGRLTEWLSGDEQVEEDKYAQKIAEDYANFIPLRPWFEYSFASSLRGLWTNTSWWGSHVIRKWERKFILTAEYSFKTVYAWMIAKGSESAYGAASEQTYIQANQVNSNDFKQYSALKNIKQLSPHQYIVSLAHEQPFTDGVSQLSDSNIQFIDVGGNQEIVMSIVAPANWDYHLKSGNVLFTMKNLTQPDLKRIVLLMPVDQLVAVVKQLLQQKIKIEHIYDY